MEKEIATHSSVLALRIPRTGKPGGLLSMGSHRVRHDWSDSSSSSSWIIEKAREFQKNIYFCFIAEKAVVPHSSTLVWKIPWMEESGRLQSRGCKELDTTERLHFHFFTFMHWRRKWQPTPVFLPGESQGQGSLAGCRLWGRTESDMTGVT